MPSLLVDVEARYAQFRDAMDRVGKDATRAGRSIEQSFGGVKTLLAGLGVGISIAGLGAFVKNTIDAADNLRDLAIGAGTSTEALASYQLIAKQSGVETETLAKGLGKLSVFMGKNAEEAKKLGLTANDPIEAYAQLADALVRIENPAQRAAVAQQVLGKSYQQQLPLLIQGGDAMRQAARESADYAKAQAALGDEADKFNDTLAKLKQTASGLGISLTSKMIGPLNDIAAAMAQAAKEAGLLKAAWVGLGGIAANLFATTDTKKRIVELNSEIADLQTTLGGLAKNASGVGVVDRFLWGDEKDLRAKMTATIAERDRLVASLTAKPLPKPKVAALDVDDILAPKKKAAGGRQESAAERRMETLREGAKELEAELEKLAADTAFQVEIDNSYAEALKDAATEQEVMRAAISETRNELQDAVEPTARWVRELERIEQLRASGFDPDLLTAYALKVHENIDAAGEFNNELEKTAGLAEDVSQALTGAFADAIAEGRNFSDVLQALEKDLLRIVLNSVFLEPIGKSISGAIKGSGAGGFLDDIFGKIFGAPGRASGGPVSAGSPYWVGERGPELFMPRTAGTVLASGAGGVTVNMVVNTPDANSFRASRTQILTDLQLGMSKARRNL